MLRRRPRRKAPSWLRHPAVGPLFLAVLYFAATIVNALLALRMDVLWPALLAGVLAGATTGCVVAAVRRFR